MTICRTCNIPMVEVRRFTPERNEKFQRCPKCFCETKHLKILERELYLEDYLHNKGAKR
uniref:TFIIB Transcription factor zinc-finger n=1 Tax=Siphoviridae sp. cttFh17 TaxID=2826491 RepID=A0A8S5NJY3_9CAUD|nr:MAG TPA: TFIIB Transcription factor zinc-finger [Siphoviridae sp. cttFh17]DAW05624.1 MAG TPA: TFIIB Transcription factor zinc-finger [Caudoviricetes sp.]